MRFRAEQVMELMMRVKATKVVVVSHGLFIAHLIRLIQPTRQTHPKLPNLHYHKITLTGDGTVIDVKTNQAWSK